jgi:hypothetical protein
MVQFTWTVRCLSMVVLATNGTSLILMHPRLGRATSKPFTFNISIFLDSPYVLFVLGMCFFVTPNWIGHLEPPPLDEFVLTILPTTAMTCLFASVYIPYFYLPDFVKAQVGDQQLSLSILSIMNAASFLGRILPSWLADK